MIHTEIAYPMKRPTLTPQQEIDLLRAMYKRQISNQALRDQSSFGQIIAAYAIGGFILFAIAAVIYLFLF